MHHCNDHPVCEYDKKHILVVIDSNETHRRDVREALMSFYQIIEFDNSSRAIAFLRNIDPGVILVGEDVPPHGGCELIRSLRFGKKYQHVPLLMALESEDAVSSAKECGANGWLVKPYRRSALINIVSKELNNTVERRWAALPEIQTKVLKGTVSSFNNLADSIASGEPIAYHEMNDACLPLVEAVNSNNFKGILSGVKDHDNYTYVHSLRVGTLLALFGHAINLPQHEQQLLATGGLLHDVGKMSIPHLVLNKPGKLSDEEFLVMKDHVAKSVHFLEQGNNVPRGVITIAGQHHEKLDGTGYPHNLESRQLNELARMAAIVDVFSALTDRRVYKPSMSPEAALAIMTDEMSRHLDQSLLAMFREVFLDAVGDAET